MCQFLEVLLLCVVELEDTVVYRPSSTVCCAPLSREINPDYNVY